LFGTLFKKFKLAGSGAGAQFTIQYDGCFTSNFKKVQQMIIIISSGLPHPTRSLGRIVCRGQNGPEGSKGILKPDFHGYT
jgi:hypothetical protein